MERSAYPSKFREGRNSFYFLSVYKHLDWRIGNKKARPSLYEPPIPELTTTLLLPQSRVNVASNVITTRLNATYNTRAKSPMLTSKWLPDGIRIVSGNSCGELAVWNRRDEAIELGFSGHDTSVQCFEFNYSHTFAASVDHGGFVKYWQPNLNFIHQAHVHADPARDLSFSPTDEKFATCGDDGYVKIWDFEQCKLDRGMPGHGSEVKCVDWHPSKGLIASGAKDSQQPMLFWDPRTDTPLCTMHIHTHAINDIKWNQEGNFLASCSKDKLVKVFDLRAMKEFNSFRGHKGDVMSFSWNPINKRCFVTGSIDGSIIFWNVNSKEPQANMDAVHEGAIWSLAWHPLGHCLVSSSNDCSNKIWGRNKVGDAYSEYLNLSNKSSFGLKKSAPDMDLVNQTDVSTSAMFSTNCQLEKNVEETYDYIYDPDVSPF